MPADSSAGTDRFETVLRRLAEGSTQYFGAPAVVEPVRCREHPGSHLLRIRVQNATGFKYAFVKIAKFEGGQPDPVRSRIAAEFEKLSRTHDAMAPYPGLSVVRPIACFPDEFCLVTEEAPGVTLSHLLNRPVFWRSAHGSRLKLVAVFKRLGLWLRAFQKTATPQGRVSLAAMRQYLDERLTLLCGTSDFTPAHRQALLSYFDAQCRDVSDDDLIRVPVHADFCPSNVVVNGYGITVLDLSEAGSGEIYHDLAHMFMHMQNLKARPWMGRRFVEELQNAMLRAFDPALTPQRPMFQLLLLQHLICHLAGLKTSPVSGLRALYHRYVWRENASRLRVLCS